MYKCRDCGYVTDKTEKEEVDGEVIDICPKCGESEIYGFDYDNDMGKE